MKKLIFVLAFLTTISAFAQTQRTTLKSGFAPFFHGVASGDPLSDAVMLWTKVTPPTGINDDIDVYWQGSGQLLDFAGRRRGYIYYGSPVHGATFGYLQKPDQSQI